jgi:hypothetical protein
MKTSILYVSEVIKPSNIESHRVDRGLYRMELTDTQLKEYLYNFDLKVSNGCILGNGMADQDCYYGDILQDIV